MKTIGLTGNAGSGKSTIAKYLAEQQDVYIVDADKVTHDMLLNKPDLDERIIKAFGPAILAENGKIHRRILGTVVFNNRNHMETYTNIIKNPLLAALDHKINCGKKMGKHVILDGALIFEYMIEDWFDKVIVVACPEYIRLERLLERTTLSEYEARNMMKQQMQQQHKIDHADYVIYSECSITMMKKQALDIFNEIIAG